MPTVGWDGGAGEAQPYFALPAARQIPSSPGTGGGRSGAMIAIAAILSVLLAILLAAFLVVLCR